MAIAIDHTSTAPGTAGNLLTWSHTVGGSDRLLLVAVATVNNASYTSSDVKFNDGTSFSLVSYEVYQTSHWYYVELFSQVAPEVGTFDIDVSANGGANFIGCCAISFTGVHQSTPLGTPAHAEITGAATIQLTGIGSAADELVVDAAACEYATTILTRDASQEPDLQNYFDGTPNTHRRLGMSTKPGAASVTMQWTGSTGDGAGIVAVSIKPAAASSVTWLRHRA